MPEYRRQALIIANSHYSDSKLSQLSSPQIDAESLAAVLRDTTIGFFNSVNVVTNGNSQQVREEIERFFSGKKRDDMLLLYFSGHGVLDPNGRLYLATNNTETDRLRSTGVSAQFVSESMNSSRSKRQILILDCCHSGAFARNSKAATNRTVGTSTAFRGDGTGRVILTATDSTQHAWEGDELIRGDGRSRFTHHLIEGLKTGQADRTQNGQITIDEMYDYVYEQVKADSPEEKPQTPQKWEFSREGNLLIAKNPYIYPKAKKPPPRRIGGIVTRGDLRLLLDDLFEIEQIENIAFDLGLDERSLGQTKSAKIRSLLRQLDHQNRLPALLDWLHRNLPDLFQRVFGKHDLVQIEASSQTTAPSTPKQSHSTAPKVTVERDIITLPKQRPQRQTGQPRTAPIQETLSPPIKQTAEQPAPSSTFSPLRRPLWGWGVAAVILIGLIIFIANNLMEGSGHVRDLIKNSRSVVMRIITRNRYDFCQL